ncbi:MAG: GNAT family N-acetyltransferase [Rhodanobacter sp.]|nr:MAG: GNAT family N-acetyltransferase [Rhodanobacter sp.]TAM10937.1 MAG: GNAT family N-acetyltransferase [Rhodanobacter sp.]TAM37678.1 MAG: GNAT family N-acetyltransferase [Rhodanobacter sp.]
MSPVIRLALPTDAADLCAWNAAMARETENLELDAATLARGVDAVFAQPQRGFYLVAELDGATVGGLLVTREWSDWHASDYWWIQSVYVVPAARQHGVFRALYAEVVRRARIAGAASLRLYVDQANRRAQQTYALLGMLPSHYAMYEQRL